MTDQLNIIKIKGAEDFVFTPTRGRNFSCIENRAKKISALREELLSFINEQSYVVKNAGFDTIIFQCAGDASAVKEAIKKINDKTLLQYKGRLGVVSAGVELERGEATEGELQKLAKLALSFEAGVLNAMSPETLKELFTPSIIEPAPAGEELKANYTAIYEFTETFIASLPQEIANVHSIIAGNSLVISFGEKHGLVNFAFKAIKEKKLVRAAVTSCFNADESALLAYNRLCECKARGFAFDFEGSTLSAEEVLAFTEWFDKINLWAKPKSKGGIGLLSIIALPLLRISDIYNSYGHKERSAKLQYELDRLPRLAKSREQLRAISEIVEAFSKPLKEGGEPFSTKALLILKLLDKR